MRTYVATTKRRANAMNAVLAILKKGPADAEDFSPPQREVLKALEDEGVIKYDWAGDAQRHRWFITTIGAETFCAVAI